MSQLALFGGKAVEPAWKPRKEMLGIPIERTSSREVEEEQTEWVCTRCADLVSRSELAESSDLICGKCEGELIKEFSKSIQIERFIKE